MTASKRRMGTYGLAGAAVLAALVATAWAADSPIVLGDGSIVIGSPNGNLNQWRAISRTVLQHPQQGNSMAEVEVAGPGATAATCVGRGRCIVEIRWSTGQSIRFASTAAGSKGARLEAQGVTFDDPAWRKTNVRWELNLPAAATPTVTIRDLSGGGQPQTVCQGKGCQVTVNMR